MEFSDSHPSKHASTGMYLTNLSDHTGLVHQILKTEPPLSFCFDSHPGPGGWSWKHPNSSDTEFYWLFQTSEFPGKSEVLPSQTKSLPSHYCAVIPWDAHHNWKSIPRSLFHWDMKILKLTPCFFTSRQALKNSEQDFVWNERRKRCKGLMALSEEGSHRETKDMK